MGYKNKSELSTEPSPPTETPPSTASSPPTANPQSIVLSSPLTEPPPPYNATYANPALQTVLYGPEETVEGAPLPPEASVQPHLHTTVILQTTPYGRLPVNVKCQHCHENVTTTVTHQADTMTWLVCLLCFIAGWCLLIPWFLCWIPFCTDGTKSAVHTCPKCNRQLAIVGTH